MRSLAWLTAIGLSFAPLGAWAAESGCSGHGTSIDFYDTPSQAATQAVKKERLVFVLHVSGNFEDPRFT
jgi:hypothetical protein